MEDDEAIHASPSKFVRVRSAPGSRAGVDGRCTERVSGACLSRVTASLTRPSPTAAASHSQCRPVTSAVVAVGAGQDAAQRNAVAIRHAGAFQTLFAAVDR